MIPDSHTSLRQTFTLALDGYPEGDHGLGQTPLYEDFIQFFARTGIVLSNANGQGLLSYFSDQLQLTRADRLVKVIPPNALPQNGERVHTLCPGYARQHA